MDTTVAPEIWFRTVLLRNGLRVDDHALRLIERYVDGLIRANKSVNLISRKDEEHIWSHHILHCVSILFALRFPDNCRVLDLGSGGGLPGIPLKIILPDLKLTMLDATNKKIAAVKTLVNDLGLSDADAVWGRAEELGAGDRFKGRFDVVVARAVGPLEELVRLAYPFLRTPSGSEARIEPRNAPRVLSHPCLVAYKGGDITAELEKARRIRYVQSVQIMPLVFDGSAETALEDKKVVIVEFT